MRLSTLLSCALAGLVGVAFMTAAPARGAADHVVISEFATRGPSSATDEFVELYNPTGSAIDISGYKLQYKSTSGTTWSDRAVLPANSIIPAHGYFLLANQSYAGTVTPDYSSSLWNSGSGMADNGHERILDAAAVEVDKVGWGTAIDPEGGVDAPNHGTSANNNSVERKALATSTADSLGAGGAHALLGNGQDTNVNGSDYVTQTHGRNPQNTGSSIEPAFSLGGNGTGRVSALPAVVYTNHSLDSLSFVFHQDSTYTLTSLAILIPSSWTWSHLPGSVVLSGSGLAGGTPSVVGDTLFVTDAALTPADSGTVTVTALTTPVLKGGSLFTVRTAVAAGTLTPVTVQPTVRVLELVPIVTLHVNDAIGVPVAPYGVGSEATVTGVVTANLSSAHTDVYLQDVTGGVDLYNAALPPSMTIAVGDSLTVTGTILQFRGLIELQPDFNLMVRNATGRTIPDPLVMTCADLNATFHGDYTEPNEGRLVRINGVTYNATASTITDASGTCAIFIPTSFPATPSVFDAVGILKQYKPGTPAPGPPFTADYELAPRTPDDIIAHPGPILLTAPYEDNQLPNSVQLHWTTDVGSTSVVYYGLTPALGDSVVDATAVTTHTVLVPGLQPATVYYYSCASADVNGSNASPTQMFITASPAQTTEQINVYFNKSVNTNVAWLHPANGNQDLVSLLVPRLNNAKRSIDAALYSLSGTPGAALANALIAAKNRGVKVRVICEYDNSGGTGFSALGAAGVPLINDRFDPINYGAGLMHNKFFVVDGRGGAPDSVWVWTGSWNPTDPGTNDDFQNSIEIQDQSLAVAYTLEFNEMWGSSTDTPNAATSRFGARKLDDTPHRFQIGARKVESYFSPSDGTNAHILATMNAAQHSLAFEELTLTRSDLSAALEAKHAAGLKVRGDLDNGTDTGSEYAGMVAAGLDVRLKTGVSGLLHHKYLLADAENPGWNATTLTGSHNWSASAENANNENTLIVHDFDITNQYLQEFVARYYQFGGSDSLTVSVDPIDGLAPRSVSLAQNFPNPSLGVTHIAYGIPTAQKVVLRLFDVQGREVRTLVNSVQAAGRYQVSVTTHGMASGVYFYRLEVGREIQQRKMLLMQ